METKLSRRLWMQRTAMAAAVLPISRWYDPYGQPSKYYSTDQLTAKGAIRLNSNENAYGPSEAAKAAAIESFKEANRYPRHFISELKNEIAKREDLTPDHIMLTAGSTEILGLAGLHFGLHGGELLACHPTFDFMLAYAEKLSCTWARTPLDKDFQYDLHALSNLTTPNTKLIFICNPNNPTGVEIPQESLAAFCKDHASQYPVFVDEAYIELSPEGKTSSMAHLVPAFGKLIISRTFSKVYGLAGMRIGYAIARPDVIKSMSDLNPGRSITLSVPAAAAALACLHDKDFENFSREKIIEGRQMVTRAFDDMGVKYLPSATNFVFFQNEKFSTDPVEALAQENIFIRNYQDVPGWSRVSIGTLDEMDIFVKAIKKYLA